MKLCIGVRDGDSKSITRDSHVTIATKKIMNIEQSTDNDIVTTNHISKGLKTDRLIF